MRYIWLEHWRKKWIYHFKKNVKEDKEGEVQEHVWCPFDGSHERSGTMMRPGTKPDTHLPNYNPVLTITHFSFLCLSFWSASKPIRAVPCFISLLLPSPDPPHLFSYILKLITHQYRQF